MVKNLLLVFYIFPRRLFQRNMRKTDMWICVSRKMNGYL